MTSKRKKEKKRKDTSDARNKSSTHRKKKNEALMITFLQRHVSLSIFSGHTFGLNVTIAKKNRMKEISKIFLANININI